MQLNINSIYTSREDVFLNNHVSQFNSTTCNKSTVLGTFFHYTFQFKKCSMACATQTASSKIHLHYGNNSCSQYIKHS